MAELVFFIVVGLVAVLAAIGVVAQRNVIYSGLLLVLNFLCLAALYILMNAQFVGVAQVIVYAGALMVLFLFAIMLLSGRRVDGLAGGPMWQRLLAVFLALVMAVELGLVALSGPLGIGGGNHPRPASVGNVQAVAALLFTRYLWAFEATALLVLIAVVGVVYLLKGRPAPDGRR